MMSASTIGRSLFITIFLLGTGAIVWYHADDDTVAPDADTGIPIEGEAFEFRLGGDPELPARIEQASKPRAPAPPGRTPGGPKTVVGPQQPRPAPKSSPGPARRTPSAPAPKSSPRHYVMKKGDSLSKVARSVYGDVRLWKKLALANRIPLDKVSRLPIGHRIRLPERESLGTLTAPPAAPGPPRREERTRLAAEPRAPKPSPQPKRYKVQRGDSLSTIAKDKLGDASKWRDLHKLNKDKLPDPAKLQVGMVLNLP
jgi:nucleoid-associated protein YgaU